MPEPTRPLTDQQDVLLTALHQHLDEHGTLPAAADLAAAAGLPSEDAVRVQFGLLVERGRLSHDPAQPGWLHITPGGRAAS